MNIGPLLRALFVGVVLAISADRAALASEAVEFTPGDKVLHGLLYKPAGAGPFPVVLFNHGSAPGMLSNQAFDLIGPLFNARGWAFFAPYRRGQGLSRDAGSYIEDDIQTAQQRGGTVTGEMTMVRLLSNEQLQDQAAALAWIKKQPFVRSSQITAMGNSFGGIETIFGTERLTYCAAIDAAGGAESWDKAPGLQSAMVRAVQHSKAPVLFMQAQNDYNLAPSRTLYSAMKAVGMPAAIRIYPAYGHSKESGHSFAWRGAGIWIDDVLRFMEAHCKP